MTATPFIQIALTDHVRMLDTLCETKAAATQLREALQGLLEAFVYAKDLDLFHDAREALARAAKAGI